MTITGDYFGPVSHALPLSLTGVGMGAEATPVLITASLCRVTVAHTTALCVMPAGVGTDFVWSLSVAGQMSTLPAVQHTSYAAPEIMRVETVYGVSRVDNTGEFDVVVSTAGMCVMCERAVAPTGVMTYNRED